MSTDFFEKLKTLPKPIFQAFMADDVLCEEVVVLYAIPNDKIQIISKPIGSIFVGEMELSDYPEEVMKAGVGESIAFGVAYEINKRFFLKFPEHFISAVSLQKEWEQKKSLPVVSEEEAKRIAYKFKPWLLEKEEEEAEEAKKVAATRERLSLVTALGKYPRLGEQMISAGRLSLKGRPEPARGNLSNWLRVYRDELGVGHHDPVLRAKFLFNSANTRNISSEERERLNVVLRSVEENTPLEIDILKFEIIFPSFQVTERRTAAPVVAHPGSQSKKEPIPSPWSVAPKTQEPIISHSSEQKPEPEMAVPASRVNPGVPAPAPKRQGFSTFSENPIDKKSAEQQPGLRIKKGIQFSGFSPKSAAPVTISTNHSVIANQSSVAPAQTPKAPAHPPVSRPKDPQPKPSVPKSGGSFSFSSKHAFPAERENRNSGSMGSAPAPRAASGKDLSIQKNIQMKQPDVRTVSQPNANSFTIRPMRKRDDGSASTTPLRNVVDLRGDTK